MESFSRGTVTIRSTDPTSQPVVSFGLLSDDRDRQRLRDGILRLRRLLQSRQIEAISHGVFIDDQGTPLDTLATDNALDDWLDSAVGAFVHACGTCRIGRADDPLAVVDPRCAVIGFENLWVVDASVLPSAPRANTHLTTVAVAERAAARIGAPA